MGSRRVGVMLWYGYGDGSTQSIAVHHSRGKAQIPFAGSVYVDIIGLRMNVYVGEVGVADQAQTRESRRIQVGWGTNCCGYA